LKKHEHLVEEIQDLLDLGMNNFQIAKKLGTYRNNIVRIIDYYDLDVYVPFNDPEDRSHLYQNFEWLWEEDILYEYMYKAFEEPVYIERSEDNLCVSLYVREKYGNLFEYMAVNDYVPLMFNIFVECTHCDTFHNISEFYRSNRDHMGITCKKLQAKYIKNYHSRNSGVVSSNNSKRRIRQYSLPFEPVPQIPFTRCALTLNKQYTIDHFIALNTGHGGNYFENYMPLELGLNSSKNDKNPFKWITFRNINRSLFEQEVERLSQLNKLTPDEYRQFVYWCYDNRRSVDEIKRDQRHSIEIWREAVGKQFPLPRYVYEVGFLNESEVS